MSIQSFQAFMAQISQDSALREELRSKAPQGMTIDQLVNEAAARGFAFEPSDVTGPLSEADLDNVAGGAARNTRSYTGSKFHLDLAGNHAGWLRSFDD